MFSFAILSYDEKGDDQDGETRLRKGGEVPEFGSGDGAKRSVCLSRKSYAIFSFHPSFFCCYLWFLERSQGEGRGHAKTRRRKDSRVLFCRFSLIAPCSRYDADATFFFVALILMAGSIHGAKTNKLNKKIWSSTSCTSVARRLLSRPFEKRTKISDTSRADAHGTGTPVCKRSNQTRDCFCIAIHCSSMWGLDERILRTARHSTMKLSGLFDLYFTFFFLYIYYFY